VGAEPSVTDRTESDLGLPFPIEFVIRETPRSHQSKDASKKERWRRTVAAAAKERIAALGDLFFLDDRPLAVTIFYFASKVVMGDIDNIVKLIVDGMLQVVFPDDRVVERVLVQRIEPDVEVAFSGATPMLEEAVDADPPLLYIRIDDDLRWRQVP
jgi:crossover junction endodeoxyribonuclease RusA